MVSAFYIFTRHSSSLNLQYLIYEDFVKFVIHVYGFSPYTLAVSVILLNLAVIIGFPTSSSMNYWHMNYGINNNNDE